VPVRLIGRKVRVMLHASELVVYDGREEVARHERLIATGGTRLDLDHYLEALVRKPGALPGDPARTGPFRGQVHPGPLRLVGSGPQGPRRPGRHPRADRRPAAEPHLVAGLAAALSAGALTADAVALEARKAAEADTTTALLDAEPFAADRATVTSLTARRLAHLPPDTRPLPSVAHYDQLLRHRRPDRPTIT